MTSPVSIAPEIRAEIGRRLDAIEAREGVRMLLAVESGSRAWGFPSPDSDYDARFIYVRPASWYVSVEPGRDVIEEEVGEIDVNGWDLRKALGLMLKGNAVLVEWLMSPVVYREDERFRAEFTQLLKAAARPAPLLHHYLNLGLSMRRNDAFRGRPFPIKKYFYALRPAVALRWLRVNGYAALPPMNLPELVAGSDLPEPLSRLLADLIEAKSRTREMGQTEPIPLLEEFLDAEFAAAEANASVLTGAARPVRQEADALLRRWAFAASEREHTSIFPRNLVNRPHADRE